MVRIQLEVPEEQLQEIEKLMADLRLRTKKDLFNNALTLLRWAAEERKCGRAIGSIDAAQGVIKELVMPALQNVPAAAGDRIAQNDPVPLLT